MLIANMLIAKPEVSGPSFALYLVHMQTFHLTYQKDMVDKPLEGILGVLVMVSCTFSSMKCKFTVTSFEW